MRFDKCLQQRIEDLTLALAGGVTQTMDAYREVVGEIRGLRYALDIHAETRKQGEQDE